MNSSARATAQSMITALRNDASLKNRRAWGVGPAELADQLEYRLSCGKTSWPNQGNTNLCGPAAFMFCLVNDRPDLYVSHIISLWAGGKATLGQRSVQPSGQVQATAEATSPQLIGPYTNSMIEAVDWISLASLRNDSPDLNPFGDYDHPSDGLSAATRPRYMRGWFDAVGATTLLDNTSEILPLGGWDELRALEPYHASGWVVMLVAAAMFEGYPSSIFTRKNHWVVLNGPITINGRPLSTYGATPPDLETASIQARVFTWGDEASALATTKSLPHLSHFLKCFFGGIAFSSIP